MDDGGPTASIILFVLLLFIDMFFYGFSAAVSALNIKEIERRAEEEKDKKSIKLKRIIGDPAEYANTLQLIVTLINVVVGALFGNLAAFDNEFPENNYREESAIGEYSSGVDCGNIHGFDYASSFVHIAYIWCAASAENSSESSGKMGLCMHYSRVFCYTLTQTFYRVGNCHSERNIVSVWCQGK